MAKPYKDVTVKCENTSQGKSKLHLSPAFLQWHPQIPVTTPKPPYVKGSVTEENSVWKEMVELTIEVKNLIFANFIKHRTCEHIVRALARAWTGPGQ